MREWKMREMERYRTRSIKNPAMVKSRHRQKHRNHWSTYSNAHSKCQTMHIWAYIRVGYSRSAFQLASNNEQSRHNRRMKESHWHRYRPVSLHSQPDRLLSAVNHCHCLWTRVVLNAKTRNSPTPTTLQPTATMFSRGLQPSAAHGPTDLCEVKSASLTHNTHWLLWPSALLCVVCDT